MGRLLLRARGERVLTSRRRDDEASFALSISTAGSILFVAAPNTSLSSSSSSAAAVSTSASTPDLARTITSLQRAAADAYERGKRGHFGNPALLRHVPVQKYLA
jgi:hypothetical protein